MPAAPDALPTRASERLSRRLDESERAGRRKRKAVKGLVLAAILLVALLASAVGAGALLLHEAVGKNITSLPDSEVFPKDDVRPPAASTGAKNILLLGSDSRETTDQHDLGAAGGQRSDVMMLVHVPADRSGFSVMSIMRDTWVPIPGHGEAKINAALAYGGTPLVVQTVEGLLGARIDHVAIIDFAGIEGMTTALGGVWVDNQIPFTSGGHFYAGGPIQLEGADALRYVRERHAFATADYQRVVNQQALLRGILTRALSRDVLGDPAQLVDFAGQTSKYLTVDSAFTLTEAGSLAYSLRGVDAADMSFFTMPTAGTGTSGDGQSIVKLDPAATSGLRDALAHDTVPAFEKDHAAS
jgi:LCP family protein required for cell wall assembly